MNRQIHIIPPDIKSISQKNIQRRSGKIAGAHSSFDDLDLPVCVPNRTKIVVSERTLKVSIAERARKHVDNLPVMRRAKLKYNTLDKKLITEAWRKVAERNTP